MYAAGEIVLVVVGIHIYEWKCFKQINFTVQELISSGNLALISNEAIKATLLRLESAYDENRAEEDPFRFDAEELLYKPLYATVDLHPMLRSFAGEEDPYLPSSTRPFNGIRVSKTAS